MSMKAALAGLAVLVLLLAGLIAGCGGRDPAADAAPGAETAVSESPFAVSAGRDPEPFQGSGRASEVAPPVVHPPAGPPGPAVKAPDPKPAGEPVPAAPPPAPEAAAGPKEPLPIRHAPPEILKTLLEFADLQRGETFYLLGSGDGEILVAAARDRGARGIGIDESPEAIAAAKENVRKAGVEDLVELRQQDLLDAEIKEAKVLLFFPRYKEPEIRKLDQKIQKDLRPGTRVVSCGYGFSGLWPDKRVSVRAEGRPWTIYLYNLAARSHPDSLAPFVPTPMPVVQRMLDLARVTKDDKVYDLGCGDGRIVVEAAKRGARGVGVDFDIQRVEEAREKAKLEGVENLVEIRHEDVLKTDFSDATVVMLYLSPEPNAKLKPKLAALKPGARIVSHAFGIEGWKPAKEETVKDGLAVGTIYLWEVGASPAGEGRGTSGGEGKPAN